MTTKPEKGCKISPVKDASRPLRASSGFWMIGIENHFLGCTSLPRVFPVTANTNGVKCHYSLIGVFFRFVDKTGDSSTK
jgi:hypothetical protein